MAAPPGPVNAMIATEAIRSPVHGTAVGAGAMTADFIFFLVVLFLSSYIPRELLTYFYFIGGVVMLYYAYGALRAKPVNVSIRGNYFKGLKMGLTNPYQITWWVAYGIPMIFSYSFYIAPGFFGGILVWIFLYPLVVHRLGKLGDKVVIGIKLFSFAVLLAFGVYSIVLGVQALKG